MSTSAPSRKLTVGDIADTRAYERVRDAFRAEMIELRRRRRVAIGTIVTVTFENRETMRFQIQEMARVEQIVTDEGIQEELDAYNPLIPEAGTALRDAVHRADIRRTDARVAAEAGRHRAFGLFCDCPTANVVRAAVEASTQPADP